MKVPQCGLSLVPSYLLRLPFAFDGCVYLYGAIIFLSFVLHRGNNITDIKEVEKLKCLPLIRALLLMGNYIS